MTLLDLPKARVYGTSLPAWPPPPRAPLPPFPPGVYDRVVPSNQHIPPAPDRRFIRANWFSVEVPGLPWLPGQSSEHPEMALSYTIHQRPWFWQAAIVQAHAARGYTHFMLDWPGARKDGLSIDEFVAMALRVKLVIPFVHVMLGAKALDPQDAGWDVMEARIAPVLRALIAAHAVDLVSLWETDLWQGARLQSNLDGIAALCQPASVDQWAHFSTGVTWWGDYPNRTAFWTNQQGILTGLLYQGDVSWDIGLRQARICDTTSNASAAPLFANGTFKFVAAEMDGMNIYNRDFSEALGDLRGYLACCTKGLTPVSGYCSGGRLPDGSVL